MTAFLLNLYRNRYLIAAAVKKSFYGQRMFYGVTFQNTDNIQIASSAHIENGSVILASDPIGKLKNIVIGDNCWIGRNVEIQSNFDSRITINEYASVQDRCKLLGNVTIGKYCILAPDIFMSSGNHTYKTHPALTIREQDRAHSGPEGFNGIDRPIVIDEDCWIGKNVFIKAGVYLGRGAIVGTNAIVTNDVAPYTIMTGSPAVKLKNRLDFDPPNIIESGNYEHRPYFYRGFKHFCRNKSTAALISENKGMACENISFAVLKKIGWQKITISGFSKCDAQLQVYVDGIQCISHDIYTSKPFEFHFNPAPEENELLQDFNILPEILKNYLCVHFVISGNKQNYDFAIAKIAVL